MFAAFIIALHGVKNYLYPDEYKPLIESFIYSNSKLQEKLGGAFDARLVNTTSVGFNMRDKGAYKRYLYILKNNDKKVKAEIIFSLDSETPEGFIIILKSLE